MEYVTLSNGVKMPVLGYGVYQVPADIAERCVLDAISVGYRHIDTAQAYGNEREVGNAIVKCGIPRDELFITTKVWITNYGYERARASVLEFLEKLQTDYIDLVLLHQPFSDYYGAYRALEEHYREGKIRAIGVSNFVPDRLADIAAFNDVVPHVNQIECNPVIQQVEAQRVMVDRHVQMQAWAPFGEGRNNMFTNPVLTDIGGHHGKTAAQVILRWLIQRNIVALAKSTRIERMRENIDIFDFTLSDEEMERIAALDTGKSLFFDHRTPEVVEWFVDMARKTRS